MRSVSCKSVLDNIIDTPYSCYVRGEGIGIFRGWGVGEEGMTTTPESGNNNKCTRKNAACRITLPQYRRIKYNSTVMEE